MSNKLTTLGYFKKRLRDCGYVVDDVYRGYSKTDPRVWTVVIDPGCASVLCTCYQNAPELGDSFFEIYDGGQFINPGRVQIKTNSIEVFISYLVRFNINNKAPSYNNPGYYQNHNNTHTETDEYRENRNKISTPTIREEELSVDEVEDK